MENQVNTAEVENKNSKEKKYVNPFIAWGSIAAELVIIVAIYMCVLFL